MADIKLRIEVNPNAETETLGAITNKVNNVGSNANLSNASFKANSDGVYINTSSPKESGREMLSWGENGILKFDSAGNLSSNGVDAGYLASETEPDEFVWGVVPSTKKYSVKLTFSNATSLKDIVVYGDSTAKQFPTKAIIDGTKTIFSDDPKWAINMETESDTHTIEFTDWNRANYNACLTNIMVMLRYFDLDKGWIDSVESLSQSTSDPSSIQYGVIANSGSANLRDLDGELEDYIKDGIIPDSNAEIKLIINGNQIQEHITSDTQYDTNNKNCSFDMTNLVNNWQNLNIAGYAFGVDVTSIYEYFRAGMYRFGISRTTSEQICSKIIRNNQTAKQIMQNGTIKYPYIKTTNLIDFINNICTLCQFSLYYDKNGTLYFRDARPRYSNETILKIPTYIQLTTPQSALILKNKYNNIKYIENSLHKETKDICNKTFYLRDSNGELTLNNIPNAQIKNNNGTSFLCFFIECNENCEYIYPTSGVIDYPFSYFIQYKNSTTSGQVVGIPYDSTNTKETFNFLTAQGNCTQLGVYDTLQSNIFAIKIPLDNDFNSTIESIQLSIFSDCIIKVTKDNRINNNIYVFDLPDNILLAKENTIDDPSIQDNTCYNVINQHILEDYQNGIKTCTLQIMCQDMYSTTGQKIKTWANGEILEVGDLVRVDKDNYGTSNYTYANGDPIIFRVTGVKFSYNGSPKLDLELQEVKQYT